MSRHAVIQGEQHASIKDAKSLLGKDSSSVDALFIEGRGPTIELGKEYSHGYILFLIGYLTLETIYLMSGWVRSLLPGENWEVKDEALAQGIEVEDEIDAELHEIWRLAEGKTRSRFYLLAVVTFIFALTSPFYLSSGVLPVGFTAVIIACFTPLLFSAGVVIFILGRDGIRDEVMAESIVGISRDKGYEHILVLCGQWHVSGIGDQLEQAGWEIEQKDSSHILTAPGRWLGASIGQ